MFYGIDPTWMILVPAILFTVYAQGKVKKAYGYYSRVPCSKGITGMQTARMILDKNGMQHVPIEIIPGNLTDNYDPTKDVMHLSEGTANSTSLAAVSIAAHESGHAIQDIKEYAFLKLRIALVPAVNMTAGVSWPLMMIGLVLIGMGNASTGNLLFNIAVIMFAVVVLFHTVTLPVELDASKRALAQLSELGIIENEEQPGARNVLSAAAMTYVAALATSIMNLIWIFTMRGRS